MKTKADQFELPGSEGAFNLAGETLAESDRAEQKAEREALERDYLRVQGQIEFFE